MSERAAKARWGRGLRRADAAEYLGLSDSMFDRARKDDPTFPKPVPLVGSVEAWDREALDRWFDDRGSIAVVEQPTETWDAP